MNNARVIIPRACIRAICMCQQECGMYYVTYNKPPPKRMVRRAQACYAHIMKKSKENGSTGKESTPEESESTH